MTDQIKDENTLAENEEKTDEVVAVPDYEDQPEEEEREYDVEAEREARMARMHIKPEDLIKSEPVELTAKEKRESFWYYYKKPIIIGMCVLFVAVYLAYLSIPEKRDYDVHVYCSQQNIESVFGLEPLADYLEQFGQDVDENGEVTALLDYYDMNANQYDYEVDEMGNQIFDENGMLKGTPKSAANPTDYYVFISSSATLQADIGKGRTFLFMLDEDNYKTIVEDYGEEIFASFDGVRFVPLYENEDFAKYCEEHNITAKLGLALVDKSEKLEKNAKKLAKWQNCYELMESIRDEHPELFGK